MDLPVMPPVKPMLCKNGTWEQVKVLLESGNGQIEPKWDGSRPVSGRARPLAAKPAVSHLWLSDPA